MRWVVRGLSGLLMLVAVLVGLVFLIPSAKVAEVAAAQFLKATGRVLTVEGDVRPTVWPVLGVQTGLVRISAPDWATEGTLLEADSLKIGVDMAALIGGDIRIREVEALRPRIVLERARDGRESWVFDAPAAPPDETAGDAAGRGFTLDIGMIRDGSLRFIDHKAGTVHALTAISGEVQLPDYKGPADVDLSARRNGAALTLKARIDGFADFAKGTVSKVAVTSSVGQTTAEFDGLLGLSPLVAEGALTANLADLPALSAATGVQIPALPQGLGAASRQIRGQITLAPVGSVHLRGGVVQLDRNRLEIDADLTFDAERPNLTAKVKGGALALAGVAGTGGTTETRAVGWSGAPIDVAGLGALDAAVTLTADSIDLGSIQLGQTRILASLVRSRLVLEARELQAYGGGVTGNFVVNGRGGLSVGGDLVFRGLSMQALLADAADFDRLLAQGDLSIKFLGVGGSVAAIMASLSGSGNLTLGKGELRGLDLGGMLRTLDVNYVGAGAKTIFDGVTASFSMQDGILRNDDLVLAAPYVTAKGAGSANLGGRTLDYRLVPTALAGADGTGGLTVPLKITGPWSGLKYQLDLKALADQELAEEKARLKERAKAEEARIKAQVEAKAEEELGIVRGEGESLEDAARRRAQEAVEAEAGRALRRLFGGN